MSIALTAPQPRSIVKGLIAGLIGGLAGAAAKTLAERLYPPRTKGQKSPPAVLAEKIAGHALTAHQKDVATQSIHWSFGPIIGAAYGVLAEYAPVVTEQHGVTFGVAVGTLTHEGALPALGLSAAVEDQPLREQSSEMISHSVYGWVTEGVRRRVRHML